MACSGGGVLLHEAGKEPSGGGRARRRECHRGARADRRRVGGDNVRLSVLRYSPRQRNLSSIFNARLKPRLDFGNRATPLGGSTTHSPPSGGTVFAGLAAETVFGTMTMRRGLGSSVAPNAGLNSTARSVLLPDGDDDRGRGVSKKACRYQRMVELNVTSGSTAFTNRKGVKNFFRWQCVTRVSRSLPLAESPQATTATPLSI